jgi:hypothetical protein
LSDWEEDPIKDNKEIVVADGYMKSLDFKTSTDSLTEAQLTMLVPGKITIPSGSMKKCKIVFYDDSMLPPKELKKEEEEKKAEEDKVAYEKFKDEMEKVLLKSFIYESIPDKADYSKKSKTKKNKEYRYRMIRL